MKYLFCLALLLLTACNIKPAPSVAVLDDKFSPDIVVNGPVYSDSSLGVYYEWRLFSIINKKSHAVTHGMYFDTSFRGKSNPLKTAYDDEGRKLYFKRLYPGKDGCRRIDYVYYCNYIEKAEILVHASDLKRHANDGFSVKVSSRDGDDYVLPITPEMIALQLKKVATIVP